jgi:hypothetical protein
MLTKSKHTFLVQYWAKRIYRSVQDGSWIKFGNGGTSLKLNLSNDVMLGPRFNLAIRPFNNIKLFKKS